MRKKIKFLLHTDLGHDPDDAIAIAILYEYGYYPSEVVLHPGYHTQTLIADRIYSQYQLFGYPPISCTKPDSVEGKYNPGKHSVFTEKNFFRSARFPIPENIVVDKALIIGPALGLGDKLECEEMFFQGGYSPNSIEPLEKFKGIKEVQSYNPSGAKEDFKKLLSSDKIKKRYYIGKNVCHGFTKGKLKELWEPSELNCCQTPNLIRKFWDKLEDSKAMHDVLAAMLFINKDMGIWEQAKPVFNGSKMTTEPTGEEIYTLIGLK